MSETLPPPDFMYHPEPTDVSDNPDNPEWARPDRPGEGVGLYEEYDFEGPGANGAASNGEGTPAPSAEVTSNGEAPATPEKRAADEVDEKFTQTVGSAAVTGANGTTEQGRTFGDRARAFRAAVSKGVATVAGLPAGKRAAAQEKFESEFFDHPGVKYQMGVMRQARLQGDQAAETRAKLMISRQITWQSERNPSRTDRWAAKLRLAPKIEERTAAARESFRERIDALPVQLNAKTSMAAAEKAKAKGDWATYNQVLAGLADRLGHNHKAGEITDTRLEGLTSYIDRRLGKIAIGEGTLAATSLDEVRKEDAADAKAWFGGIERAHNDLDQEKAARIAKAEAEREAQRQAREAQKAKWLDPANVLELKKSIDDEVASKVKEATVHGQLVAGFDRNRAVREVTEKYLQDYYGFKTDRLEKGRVVPMKQVQEKVLDMLDLSNYELKELIGQKKSRLNTAPITYKPTDERGRPIAIKDEDGEVMRDPRTNEVMHVTKATRTTRVNGDRAVLMGMTEEEKAAARAAAPPASAAPSAETAALRDTVTQLAAAVSAGRQRPERNGNGNRERHPGHTPEYIRRAQLTPQLEFNMTKEEYTEKIGGIAAPSVSKAYKSHTIFPIDPNVRLNPNNGHGGSRAGETPPEELRRAA